MSVRWFIYSAPLTLNTTRHQARWVEIRDQSDTMSKYKLLCSSDAAGMKVKSEKKVVRMTERAHLTYFASQRQRKESHLFSSLSGSNCFILFQIWWVTHFIVHRFPCQAKLSETRWMKERALKRKVKKIVNAPFDLSKWIEMSLENQFTASRISYVSRKCKWCAALQNQLTDLTTVFIYTCSSPVRDRKRCHSSLQSSKPVRGENDFLLPHRI